ncbi:MAG: flagellar motor protein MotB [Candidatus Schekmanbacteria bacterium]|nr:flagellar motor protein MotB [Candidatus Schekmanbacteria bacterium]
MGKTRGSVRPKLPGWVPLFTSLMIIMLAFFILLTTYTQFEEKKTVDALGSIHGKFGPFDAEGGEGSSGKPGIRTPGDSLVGADAGNAVTSAEVAEFQEARLKEKLEQALAQAGIEGEVEVAETARGVELSVGETVFFEPGSAALLASAGTRVDALCKVIATTPNDLLVEGHTDSTRPSPSARYKTNWELSTARAVAVLRYLVESCGLAPKRVSAAGRSDLFPKEDNGTTAGRAANRRVEIILVGASLNDRADQMGDGQANPGSPGGGKPGVGPRPRGTGPRGGQGRLDPEGFDTMEAI